MHGVFCDREPLGPEVRHDRLFECGAERTPTTGRTRRRRLRAAGHRRYDHNAGRVLSGGVLPLAECDGRRGGGVLGVNPFNRRSGEAKLQARKLRAFEEDWRCRGKTILRGDGLSFFADEKNASALMYAAGTDRSPRGLLKAHLKRLGSGDYFALLAYVERNAFNSEQLGTMRRLVRNARRVATCGGFGPRYLHSTGQAYKGGPNTGVFLLITHEQAADLPVPGHKYTFGAVQAAQARGDFQVLAERDRRILRVHLGPDVPAGLEALTELMREAVQ